MRVLRSLSIGLWMALVPLAADAQEKPIRIGVLEDLSGVFADVTGPGTVAAAQMAANDFGPVLGRKVEILSADHQNKADVASTIVRRWLDLDDVEMITGLGNTAVALAARGVASSKGKIDIVTSGGSSELTGKACTPTSFHWVYDTYALAKTVGGATVKSGADTLFFVVADYAFGAALARDGTRFAEAVGGKILGSVRVPLNSSDFGSFILQAQASRAKAVMLAIAGQDLVNFIKQAGEFQVAQGGQHLAAFVSFATDIHALGLKTTQGLLLSEAFYWDMDDATREFGKRFFVTRKAMPNSMQAGAYSAVWHYLTAVKAAGTTDSQKVAAKMRETPINDFMTKNGRIREDGRVLRDFYLFEVKKPEESTGAWDLMKKVQSLSGDEAFRPLSESECPSVKEAQAKK
ncbi:MULTISPECIES: ABC transporter substrate-binding protein [unclassified Bradyrhizobium]|uniref:ABC transporter substrate-binding protein n=1 Tax=unclassified Bradyrhizobium TaxID=2631580 RepID=UPI0028968FC8|nr:ABC transporter substrate-binding protein [Bradyrhizobium sp. AUGA SZCCT0042]